MSRDLEFVQRGKVLIVRRQFQEAAKVCRLGLLANPTLVEGRLVLGMALMALGRYDDVLAEMRVALEVEPNSAFAVLLKGEALFYKNDHVQAAEVLKRALELDPLSEKASKLLRDIHAAREGGLAPAGGPESTETKEYPVASGRSGESTGSGLLDLPEALPAPGATAPGTRGTQDFGVDETELDPSAARVSDLGNDLAERPGPQASDQRRSRDHDTFEESSSTGRQSTEPRVERKVQGPLPQSWILPAEEALDEEDSSPAVVVPSERSVTFLHGTNVQEDATFSDAETFPLREQVGDVDADAARVEDYGETGGEDDDDYSDEPQRPNIPPLPPGAAPAQESTTDIVARMAEEANGSGDAPLDPVRRHETAPTRPASPFASSRTNPPRRESSFGQGMQTEPAHTPDGSMAPSLSSSRGGAVRTVAPWEKSPSRPAWAHARRPGLVERTGVAVRVFASLWSPWTLLVFGAVIVVGVSMGLAIRTWRAQHDVTRRKELAHLQLATGNVHGYRWAETAYEQILAVYPTDAMARAGHALVRAAMVYEFDEPDRGVRAELDAARKVQTPESAPLLAAADVYVELAHGEADEAEKKARNDQMGFEGDPLLAYLVGRAQLLRGNARVACDSFRTALKRDPQWVLALYGLGRSLEALRETTEAQRAYDLALRLNPKHVATIVADARMRVALRRDLELAERDLDRVVTDLRPEASRAQLAWAQLGLAELSGRKGEVERAERALEQAQTGGPELNPEFWESAAQVALRLWELDKAKKYAERSVRIAPKAPGPCLALVAALLEAGNAQDALRQLSQPPLALLREPPVERFLLAARAQLALGRPKEAKQQLSDPIVRRAGDLPEVIIVVARTDVALGNAKEAVKALRELAERFPSDAETQVALGLALEADKQPAAREVLEQACTLSPRAYEPRRALARLLRRQGKLTDAAARLEEAARLVPPDIDLERELGGLLYEIGDLAGAGRALEVARQSRPDRTTLLLMAHVAAASGDQAEAKRLTDLLAVLKVPPAILVKVRAEAALVALAFRESQAMAKRALALAPGDAEARALYALALAGSGQVTEAEKFLQFGIGRLGNRADLLLALGRIGADDDRPNARLLDRALQAAKAEKKPPRVLSEAQTLLGRAYDADGSIGWALGAYDEALALNPHNPYANYYRGLLLSGEERYRDARRDIEAATRLRPPVPDAYFQLGKLLQKSGDRTGARNAYTEYVRRWPSGDHVDTARRELASMN